MSRKEVVRPGLIKALVAGPLTNRQVAATLRVSVRRVQRLAMGTTEAFAPLRGHSERKTVSRTRYEKPTESGASSRSSQGRCRRFQAQQLAPWCSVGSSKLPLALFLLPRSVGTQAAQFSKRGSIGNSWMGSPEGRRLPNPCCAGRTPLPRPCASPRRPSRRASFPRGRAGPSSG
jgi:hypothetical protein